MPQIKTGYLYGVRGMLITPLEADGSAKAEPTSYWMDVPQTINASIVSEDGETAKLRGGDRLLVYGEESDIVVGVDLSIENAKCELELIALINGGTVLTTDVEGSPVNSGYEAPTIAQQATERPFEAEVYVQNFSSGRARDGYLKYVYRFCTGRCDGIDHADQDWGIEKFAVKCRENPATGASVYKKEFVDALPAEAA